MKVQTNKVDMRYLQCCRYNGRNVPKCYSELVLSQSCGDVSVCVRPNFGVNSEADTRYLPSLLG